MYFYGSEHAHKEYLQTLVESRQGIDLDCDELADPIALETGTDERQRTKIFYCDLGKSCQKESIEKNHEYIRYVIPKGNTFDLLNEESVVKLMNHINSTSRPGLNERTPMELAELLLEDKVKEKLKLAIIPGDDVYLTPELFKY